MSLLVPKGYKVIAVRDDVRGNCVISLNPDEKLFFLVVNGKGMGPISLDDIKALNLNLEDVIGMKGMYNFIEEYDPDGTKRDGI